MKVSTIGFVVVDARERVAAIDALRDAGISDIAGYLDAHPVEVEVMRAGARILDLNEAAVRMFGARNRFDIIGQRTHRFFDPLCTAQPNSMRAYVAGASSFQQQARSVRLDGSRFDTLFCVVPWADGSTPGIWLAVFVDITEHVQRQASLDALRDELAHVSRISMLGEMSASIAHEIGQPLSSISMSGGAMLHLLDREEIDREALRRQCRRIVDQTARASDIIDRIRRMATKRGGVTAPVALADVVAESVQFVRHELVRSNIDFRYLPPSGLPTVVADKVQLQQVFVNLLMNAIQMHQQTETRDPEIQISVAEQVGVIRVDVRDNGPGIEPGDMSRLFDGFFSTRNDGLGLGLSICRTILAAHAGSIEATNRSEGRGAIFSVCLPLSMA